MFYYISNVISNFIKSGSSYVNINLVLWERIYLVISLIVFVLYVFQKPSSWILNSLKKILGLVTYYRYGFASKCVLDVFLIMESIYGWLQWRLKSQKCSKKSKKEATNKPNYFHLTTYIFLYAHTMLLVFYFGVRGKYKYIDFIHSVIMIIAYYLLAHKKKEAWLFVLASSLLYSYLLYQNNSVILFKYVIYAPISVLGFSRWKKNEQKNKKINDDK